jgi:membrane protease YdiL (CAAX protease family)
VRRSGVPLTRNETTEVSKSWQGKAWTQLLAVVLGVVPLYTILIILELRSEQTISLHGFFLYLAVISPLGIVIALLLLRFLCGESRRDLNLKSGKLFSDLFAVLVLSLLVIVANIISTSLLSEWLPESSSSRSVTDLFAELAGNPGLLVLFVGPLFLLGAASEEVIRVFLLSRLWKVWPSIPAKVVSILISAGLFGLIHLYKGPVSAAWTGIFGLIMAFFYLRFGRAVPLILAHYLTNAFQAIVFVVLAR